jgi:signal transduction histidine kinase
VFLLSLLAWTAVGAMFFGQDVVRRLYWSIPSPWAETEFWAVRVFLFAALTPAILWAGKRWPIDRRTWPARVPLHLLASVIFALAKAVLEASADVAFDTLPNAAAPRTFTDALAIVLIFGSHMSVIAYWVIIALQCGARYYRKYQEGRHQALQLEVRASLLQAQVARAQLSALKAQLQPHFLFNTLNAIMVLVRQHKGREAEDALGRFSDLLRAVLADMDQQEVPLSKELEYVQLYLSIEQMRFSDRLRVQIAANPETLDAAVPHMALQPIVENAVRHGIGSRAGGGTIAIRAARTDGTLQITIEDDGPGFPPSDWKGRGIGLGNTAARLQQLYGEGAQLRCDSRPGGGATVIMRLPYRVADAQAKQAVVGDFVYAAE